ncbi:hypothetical protein [Haloarchaeobius iranensis]|uniref:Uncharacterized protein n=1 Tax=Haloarchaeobius iranensis TaxID=996166 RepID=A0A1G9YWZ2_9EURY|nr:hypothetical protein [Haloarchaeobius iranensis]SDN13624.1 hypothetical protein SAMN05192554_11687 [Haloarchaeobius iranensis]
MSLNNKAPAPASVSIAARDALATWLAFLALLLVAGVATGVWLPADIPLREALTDVGPLYGLLSLGLVALPVFALRRYRFRSPVTLLVAWLVLGVAFGLTLGFQPVRGLYIAVLYGFLPVAAYPLLAGVEFVFRRMGAKKSSSAA